MKSYLDFQRDVKHLEEELVKLQKVDVDTQLDGTWFYETYNYSNQIKKGHNIPTKKILSK